jgi:hypothetical protein
MQVQLLPLLPNNKTTVKRMAMIDDLRKRVTDDVFEMTATVGLVTPLVTGEVRSPNPPQLLLRRVLSRHVVLVLTRLHAKAGAGRSGVTASIDALLNALRASSILPPDMITGFNARREMLLTNMEADGVDAADVNLFRNVELAHSLLAHNPQRADILWSTVSALAHGTGELVADMEAEIVRTGARPMPLLGPDERLGWVEHGRSLYR